MTDGFRDSGVHEFKREIPEEEEEIVVSSEDEVIPEEAVVPGGILPGEEVVPVEEPADNVEGQDNQPPPAANPNPDPAPNNPPPPGNNPNPDPCLLYTSPSPRDS